LIENFSIIKSCKNDSGGSLVFKNTHKSLLQP
jgi:hypothetical protein